MALSQSERRTALHCCKGMEHHALEVEAASNGALRAAAGGAGTHFEDPRSSAVAGGGATVRVASRSCSAFHSAPAIRFMPALWPFQISWGTLGGLDDPATTRVHRPCSITHHF